jgi:hypothetical protein
LERMVTRASRASGSPASLRPSTTGPRRGSLCCSWVRSWRAADGRSPVGSEPLNWSWRWNSCGGRKPGWGSWPSPSGLSSMPGQPLCPTASAREATAQKMRHVRHARHGTSQIIVRYVLAKPWPARLMRHDSSWFRLMASAFANERLRASLYCCVMRSNPGWRAAGADRIAFGRRTVAPSRSIGTNGQAGLF